MDTVLGTVVTPAGLTHAKTVPARRINAFADPGLGFSPVTHGFAIDRAGIAFTDGISVVGDQRIRIDLEALRIIGDGLAWAPASFFDQDGNPIPACAAERWRASSPGWRETGLRGSGRPRDRVPARRPRGQPVAGQPVGAVRARRRAGTRGIRPRRHRRGRRRSGWASSSSIPSTASTSSRSR